MPDRDLKLNSLSRYSKKSPRLVLEEHSHCEVPAGCGGVVLRWRNPNTSILCEIQMVRRGDYEQEETTLDGEAIKTKPHLSFGEHVVAMKLTGIDHQHGVLMFALKVDEKYSETVALKGDDRILSKPDGTWKYTTVRPPDEDWRKAGFDDSGWSVMVAKAMQREQNKQYSAINYAIDKQEKLGSTSLGIDQKVTEIWIRKVFHIEREDG